MSVNSEPNLDAVFPDRGDVGVAADHEGEIADADFVAGDAPATAKDTADTPGHTLAHSLDDVAAPRVVGADGVRVPEPDNSESSSDDGEGYHGSESGSQDADSNCFVEFDNDDDSFDGFNDDGPKSDEIDDDDCAAAAASTAVPFSPALIGNFLATGVSFFIAFGGSLRVCTDIQSWLARIPALAILDGAPLVSVPNQRAPLELTSIDDWVYIASDYRIGRLPDAVPTPDSVAVVLLHAGLFPSVLCDAPRATLDTVYRFVEVLHENFNGAGNFAQVKAHELVWFARCRQGTHVMLKLPGHNNLYEWVDAEDGGILSIAVLQNATAAQRQQIARPFLAMRIFWSLMQNQHLAVVNIDYINLGCYLDASLMLSRLGSCTTLQEISLRGCDLKSNHVNAFFSSAVATLATAGATALRRVNFTWAHGDDYDHFNEGFNFGPDPVAAVHLLLQLTTFVIDVAALFFREIEPLVWCLENPDCTLDKIKVNAVFNTTSELLALHRINSLYFGQLVEAQLEKMAVKVRLYRTLHCFDSISRPAAEDMSSTLEPGGDVRGTFPRLPTEVWKTIVMDFCLPLFAIRK